MTKPGGVPVRSPFTVAWGNDQRVVLEQLARSRTAPLRRAQRAKAALAAAGDASTAATARELGVHVATVRRWRKRFHFEGMAALPDRPRPGRPRRYRPGVHRAIVATVTSARATIDSPADAQVDRRFPGLLRNHRPRPGGSRSIWAASPIWSAAGSPVPAARTFLPRPPGCAPFNRHHPPDSAVLSVEEKTAMQARSRRHPARPAQPGRPEQREFGYRRHGTASVIAALDVHTGQVLAEDIARNDSAALIGLLRLLDQAIDPALTIYVILGNGSPHVSWATWGWLATHPRFIVHHTPKHASWLNQAGIFFSILTRRLLRRGESTSRQDLIGQIRDFTLAYNDQARPFRWACDGIPLKAA